MALSESQRAANDKYISAHYQRLPVSYSKEFCAQVRAAAEASGESLAGYVRKAIEMRMAQEVTNGKEDPHRRPD